MKVEWARYLFDLRIGFRRDGEWKNSLTFLKPVTQNFWNGVVSLNMYMVKVSGFPIPIPRLAMVVRFARNWWFEASTPAILFDRGEWSFGKFVIMNWESEEKFNPDCNAKGWEEGPV